MKRDDSSLTMPIEFFVLFLQRMLDLEYEECLKSTKSRNIEDYDQGPTGDDWDKEIMTDPQAAAAQGYAQVEG